MQKPPTKERLIGKWCKYKCRKCGRNYELFTVLPLKDSQKYCAGCRIEGI